MTYYIYCLPNFGSFGKAVSEEKIQIRKVDRRWITDDGRQVIANDHMIFFQVSYKVNFQKKISQGGA
jgi:hypothetical protein